MGICANCGEVLERAWKYCIHCGAAVSSVPSIPGAIRPDVEPDKRRSRLDLPRLIGVALAVAGVGVISYLVVLFVLARG